MKSLPHENKRHAFEIIGLRQCPGLKEPMNGCYRELLETVKIFYNWHTLGRKGRPRTAWMDMTIFKGWIGLTLEQAVYSTAHRRVMESNHPQYSQPLHWVHRDYKQHVIGYWLCALVNIVTGMATLWEEKDTERESSLPLYCQTLESARASSTHSRTRSPTRLTRGWGRVLPRGRISARANQRAATGCSGYR